jgi:hypothetical protein
MVALSVFFGGNKFTKQSRRSVRVTSALSGKTVLSSDPVKEDIPRICEERSERDKLLVDVTSGS